MKYLWILSACMFLQLCCIESKAQNGDENTVTKGPDIGTLLIIGGAAQDIFYDKFMQLCGGPDAPIVVIPTAASSNFLDNKYLENFRQRFLERGFTDVTVLHTRNPKESNTRDFVAPIQRAKGVWFSGGRQWRHADSYLNTNAHDEFWDVLKRGGVIAGSSAGATIQGSYLARGDTKANTIMMGDHEEGLNFLSNVAIDQHLFARNRSFDMFEILDHRPELLGIGLDENTGIIVKGDRFRVMGTSYVAIYDGTRWSAERDTIYQLPQGSREFYMLKSGQEYDLINRKVVEFEDRKYIDISEQDLVNYTGTYFRQNSRQIIEISIEAGNLQIRQLWNDSVYKILPESMETFISERFGAPIDFKFESEEVTGFDLFGNNILYDKVSH